MESIKALGLDQSRPSSVPGATGGVSAIP
jgi:hypothetical protein